MEVIGKVDLSHVNSFLKGNTEWDTVLFTDKNLAYVDLEDIIDIYCTVVSGRETTSDILKR
jgi:hypothetical protein